MVVGCGHYNIVGDNLVHSFQETILTTITTSFVVKTMVKQKLWNWRHFPSMFWCSCIFYFHWTILCFLKWRLDTPSFVDKIVERHSSFWFLFVIKPIHLCGEYSIYCFLPMCNGAIRTNLEWIAKFGLWQDPCIKNLIIVDYFQWRCLVWIVVDAFDCLKPFPNARHGQKIWWSCLV